MKNILELLLYNWNVCPTLDIHLIVNTYTLCNLESMNKILIFMFFFYNILTIEYTIIGYTIDNFIMKRKNKRPGKEVIPYMSKSKLLFFMYSYTSNRWDPSEQHPRSRTRFLCWMLVIILTSDRNSDSPCCDFSTDNFFTATHLSSANVPWRDRDNTHSKYHLLIKNQVCLRASNPF